MPNTYVLVVRCNENTEIEVGSLGRIQFRDGWYCYIGSSRSASFSRLERHAEVSDNINTTTYWHIDYLNHNSNTNIVEAYTTLSLEECEVADTFEDFEGIDRFGCSDCQCDSHLFYSEDLDKVEEHLDSTMDDKSKYGSDLLDY